MISINIDPVEYSLLLFTLEKQQKEITKLKDYLDFMEPKFKKSKQSKNIDLSIPVKNWNCQHFIRYFLNLYQNGYGEIYLMEDYSWRLEAFKITKFWERYRKLSKYQYKDFIDYLFGTVSEKYKLKMGLITNDDQLENYKNYCNKQDKKVYNEENNETVRKVVEDLPEIKEDTKETVEKLRRTFGSK